MYFRTLFTLSHGCIIERISSGIVYLRIGLLGLVGLANMGDLLV